MLTSLLLLALTQTPECRTSGTTTACGYNCRAELSEVKCAQTPQGVCQRIEGQLVCWDPPEEVRFHAAPAAPVCKAKFRDVACGYTCATSPDKIACTQTPWGVCGTRHGEVKCWDPAPAVVHHFANTGELRGATCVHTAQGIECGWDCKTSYREVQCAQTPKGVCRVVDGRIACFDPPLPPITHAN